VALSGLNADSFELSTATLPSFAPADTASFTVTPKTGLVPGVYTATVTITPAAGNSSPSAPVSFEVRLTVVAAAPAATAIPALHPAALVLLALMLMGWGWRRRV
jgi:hypothetical protein